MNMYHNDAYRAAFLSYIRKGTPIRLSRKDFVKTQQYVWHTQQDGKVSGAHRINDGRVLSWSNPPPTGHPGQDFNCRCQAIPYIEGETEFAYHDITTELSSTGERWSDVDFVQHYYFGGGRDVDLREIGHLHEIVEQYAWNDGAEGAFRRLADQIADKARTAKSGQFMHDFEGSYNFGSVEFSHGGGTVAGIFNGTVSRRDAVLEIQGKSDFEFFDEFIDPLSLGIEVGGTPYKIRGSWSANFTASVFVDKGRSRYFVGSKG
jgi:hypothetical protein